MTHNNLAFPLDFQFQEDLLLADLKVCQQKEWILHFNQQDYSGEWASIALQSKTGKSSDIYAFSGTENKYQPTELLTECPYFQHIISQFHAPLEAIRLLNLMPNSKIKTHRDVGCCYEDGCFRLHIPITTDEQVDFIVGGEKLDMQVGTCWYANFNLPHSVVHRGSKPRIHLIIDGLRNEWSDKLFLKAGYDFAADKKRNELSVETKKQMIESLLLMNNEASKDLIQKLMSEIS